MFLVIAGLVCIALSGLHFWLRRTTPELVGFSRSGVDWQRYGEDRDYRLRTRNLMSLSVRTQLRWPLLILGLLCIAAAPFA